MKEIYKYVTAIGTCCYFDFGVSYYLIKYEYII